jgi:hypothetical protein
MRAKMVEPLHCCVYLCVFLGIGWNPVGAKVVECLHCCVYLSRFVRIALNPAYAREDSGAFALLEVGPNGHTLSLSL